MILRNFTPKKIFQKIFSKKAKVFGKCADIYIRSEGKYFPVGKSPEGMKPEKTLGACDVRLTD